MVEGFKGETVPRAGCGMGGSPVGGVVGVETTAVEGLGERLWGWCERPGVGSGGLGRGLGWAGLRGRLFPERRCGKGIGIVGRAACVRGGLLGGGIWGVLA